MPSAEVFWKSISVVSGIAAVLWIVLSVAHPDPINVVNANVSILFCLVAWHFGEHHAA